MKLQKAIEYLEEKLQQDSFLCEEYRKEHLELLEWLEELRESRKVIRSIQQQLLNSKICVLNSKGEIGEDYD